MRKAINQYDRKCEIDSGAANSRVGHINKELKKMTDKVKYYIHAVIVVCFMFFFRFVPPVGPITELGMAILGIFIGCLWGWIATENLVWPSVLAWIAIGVTTDYMTVGAAITSVFSNGTIILIIGLLLFAGIINSCGLTVNMSYALVNAKFAKGKPWALSMMILLASFWSSALVSGIAGSLICFEIVYSISKQLGYKPRESWPAMMVAGVIFAACVGGALMPYKQGVVASYGFLSATDPSLTYNYGEYFIFGIVFSVIVMALYLLGCMFILKPDMSKIKNAQFELDELPPLTERQKFTTALLVILVAVLLIPSFLPKTWVVTQVFMKIGTNGLVFAVIGLAIFMRNKEGNYYLSMKEIAPSVSWELVFMVGTALTVGPALSSPETGIRDVFINLLIPLSNGQGAYLFTVILVVGVLIGTNFINNAVMGAIFIPIVAVIYADVGVNPIAVVALISFASNVAILLPSASPLGAILNGQKEWISTKQIVQQSVLCMAVTAITIAVTIPVANLIMSI